jgi:hypothetical protein
LLLHPLGERIAGVLEDVTDRAEEQCQRRPQLVAHVGEEGGLGAVELGEGLRAEPLGLEGADVHHDTGELARHELVEGPVLGVQREVGAPAGEQQAQRLAVPRGGEGQDDGLGDPVAEGTAGHPETVDDPGQLGLAAGRRREQLGSAAH